MHIKSKYLCAQCHFIGQTGFEHIKVALNPLYTSGLFHCYILDEYMHICHFSVVGSVLLLLFYF